MPLNKTRLALALLGGGVVLLGLLALLVGWRLLQASPVYQFMQARRRWEARPFNHYRLAFDHGFTRGGYAQCHHDVEVWNERIVHVFGATCLSGHVTQALTVSGIFDKFERYFAERVCSATGCYCEGAYLVRATYDPVLGYPQTITTGFHRNWVDDFLHNKLGVQDCLRTDPTVEKISVTSLTPLP